ncbi:hypothetical protein [Shewanella phage FishSpeaker]|nr:hypothetical protein [Shewanella phage FishSpeaker]
MSIICYKAGILAADGIETHRDLISSLNIEKIVKADKSNKWSILGKRIVAFAACGTVTADITMRKCLTEGIGLEKQFINVCHDEFSALCIDDSGNSYIIDSIIDNGVHKLIIVDVKPLQFPIAIGVASETARALMTSSLDYNAVDAVKFNCENFISCGGTIQEVNIAKLVKELND